MGETKNTYKVSVRSPEGKILLKYKDIDKKNNIKMDLDVVALLGCYVANIGSCLPTFQENLSVPSSRVKHSIGCLNLE